MPRQLGWWADQAGAIGGAFLHTPPHPLLLTAVPADAAADLAVALTARPLNGVNGYAEAAGAFAATWRAATPGGGVTEERRLRLYRLGELTWPDPAPRVAADADLANPTSNSIYQRIGYRAVEDRVVLAFSIR
jgi:hypothetical protein